MKTKHPVGRIAVPFSFEWAPKDPYCVDLWKLETFVTKVRGDTQQFLIGLPEVVGLDISILINNQDQPINIRVGCKNKQHRYDWASCTKSVSSLTLLILMEKQGVRLDESVTKYLPGFCGPYTEFLTIRHLLAYLCYARLPENFNNLSWEEMKSAILTCGLTEMPGNKHTYKNWQAYVVGLLVETLSSLRLDEAITKYVLKPLGISDVSFTWTRSVVPSSDDRKIHQRDETARKFPHPIGIAGLYGGAESLARIFFNLTTEELLGPEMRQAMFRNQLEKGMYGLGFDGQGEVWFSEFYERPPFTERHAFHTPRLQDGFRFMTGYTGATSMVLRSHEIGGHGTIPSFAISMMPLGVINRDVLSPKDWQAYKDFRKHLLWRTWQFVGYVFAPSLAPKSRSGVDERGFL